MTRVVRPRRIRVAGLAALAVAAGALAACSSGGTSSSAPAADATAGTVSGGGSSCVSHAQAAVTAALKPMQLDPGSAVDGKAAAGKTIWFISPDQSIPYVSEQAQAIQQAAKLVGVNVKIFDGKSTPTLFNQGIATAVGQGAAGIILNSTDPSLVSGPLAQAVAKHIPMIDSLVGLPGDPQTPGIGTTLRVDTVQMGRTVADYALAQTQCKANILMLTTTVYPFDDNIGIGVSDEVKQQCPSCGLDVQVINPTNIATDIGPLVSSQLRRDPGINYIIPAYTGLIPYITPAVQQLGRTIPIVSAAGVDSDFDQIRTGQQAADLALPPAAYFGYLQFDAILREITGAKPASSTLPTQLIDKTNIGTSNDLATLFPGIKNYTTVYATLWGAG